MLPDQFRCYLVTKDADGRVTGRIAERPLAELPEGEVLVRVAYSSLNYKDALGATGHVGVNRRFPNIPGVDAGGVVAQSGVYEFVPGDPVVVTGFDMGMNRWGGWAQYVRVPQDWIVRLPQGMTLRESMILGSAGFTAGLCADALQKHDVLPDRGEVLVTGASGGVGSIAVALLAKLGYRVVASTGKSTAHELLGKLGASEILAREAVDDRSGRPLLSGRWAGVIDTVGGNTLATVIRSTRHGGCVASVGLTGGNDLSITVYPFILRAVVLAGIDAAWCPLPIRHQTWARLAGPWRLDCLPTIAQTVPLDAVSSHIEAILAGRMVGRVVLEIGGEAAAEAVYT
jgi:putative YhdH/YhfP family quinone oxidoreductase